MMDMDQRPQAAQETLRPRNGIIIPLKRLIWRGRKHGEKANGVGTIAVNEFLRVDRIALGLGHFGAIFEHHALSQKALKRLIRVD